MSFQTYFYTGDIVQLEAALKNDPWLANKPLALPDNTATAVPLHRVCDGVSMKQYPETIGIEIAKLLLQYGADVNPVVENNSDSPLTAAASLICDQIALLYIQHGANIHHRGCHGGSALHWAAWCGRDVVVKQLLTMNPDINMRCISFTATPLFWAMHGRLNSGMKYNHVECARLLLAHDADRSIPNIDGNIPEELIYEHDQEMRAVFNV